jgi:mannose-6-phosphate isomerase-like protein (cupin superfamily)
MSPTTSKRSVKPLVLHIADIEHVASECFPLPNEGGNVSWKTLVSCDRTNTDTFMVGTATCPAGTSAACPGSDSSSAQNVDKDAGHLKLHRHTHPELYHVTEGQGIVTLDGLGYEVGKGSVVFIPGDAEHGIRNTGKGELVWLYVFAADGFGDVVYRFSGLERQGEGVTAKR